MTSTQEFAERIVGAVDSASLAILLSLGHQTRLLDTMADLPPSTSPQIADAAGLNERYVREWLGGMAASQVVDFDAAASTYFLPRDHAAVLTRTAGPDNLARSRSLSHCWVRWSRRSSVASTTAADCHTATTHAFTR